MNTKRGLARGISLERHIAKVYNTGQLHWNTQVKLDRILFLIYQFITAHSLLDVIES